MFPREIDNTTRSVFTRCPRRFYWEYIAQVAPKVDISVPLVAGAAFARGLEVARRTYAREGKSPEDARVAGARALMAAYTIAPDAVPATQSARALPYVLMAYDGYLERFPLRTDPLRIVTLEGHPTVEYTFAVPLDVPHPETGDPLLYTGRYDWTAQNGQGLWFCVDEKTTTRMGMGWAEGWDLSGQFIGYMWAARSQGLPISGTVVRGVKLLKKGPEFAEALVYHSPAREARWQASLRYTIQAMLWCYSHDVWPEVYNFTCRMGCPYGVLCAAENQGPWLAAQYEHRARWSPLADAEKKGD